MRKFIVLLFFEIILCQSVVNLKYHSFDLNIPKKNNNSLFMKSLVLPGWGQLSGEQPIWKPLMFFSSELILWYANNSLQNKALSLQNEFESFADDHWALDRWYANTQRIFPNNWENILIGTHHLDLIVNDKYEKSYNLVSILKLYDFSQIQVIRDRDFYENIGKYDQFVGGWDDEYDDPFDSSGNWFSVRKKNVESIILTKRKDHYRDIRYRSNSMKHYSKYAVSSIMINHLISALDAQIFGKSEEKNIALSHFNISYHGKIVNGVKVTYMW